MTTKAYSVCAFTENCRKWCKMMVARGHDVTLYAGEEDESGAKLVTCITKEQQAEIGFTGPDSILKQDVYSSMKFWMFFNARVIHEMKQRIRPRDFICLSMGEPCMSPVVSAFPKHIRVEYTTGYAGIHPDTHHVYPSHAWEHFVAGYKNIDGKYYDAVIPHYLETADFPFVHDPQDYFMWIGRLNARKGFRTAAQVARELNTRLVVAGPNGPPPYGEYVGVVNPTERGRLMSNAKVLFAPTEYIGPFELVFAEVLMCGTPVITTDWGAFTEFVENGVDGFRCRTMAQFVQAAKDAPQLCREDIAARARARFSTNVIAEQYERYFERLNDLWGRGFYA